MVTITSIAGGAPKPVFDRLGSVYGQRTGNTLNALYDTMSGIKERVAKGEGLDVLLMPVGMLDDYEKAGVVLAKGRAPLANIELGIGIKAGSALPDVSTPDALRKTLQAAGSVVHAPPTATPSGAQSDKVIRELGLAGDASLRVLHKAGLAGGVAAIASGEATLGIFPKSEIVAFDGVTLIGGLPTSLQLTITYGAAVTVRCPAPDAAAAFIQFLIAPDSRAVWNACGFDKP